MSECKEYGIGYNEQSDKCIECLSAIGCKLKTEEIINKGLTPKPIKQPMDISITKDSKNVIMTLRIDAEWLKKRLGWNKK